MGSRSKNKHKKKSQKRQSTLAERMIPFGVGIVLVAGSLYFALKSNAIRDDELAAIDVTLAADPEVDHYTIKRSHYYRLLLKTKEYKREFQISDAAYNATDVQALINDLKGGDHIQLKVRADEVEGLDADRYFNSRKDVLGVVKGTMSYVDLTKREHIIDRDARWAYLFTLLGLVMVPYGFIKTKPFISLDRAIKIFTFGGLALFILIRLIQRLS